MSEPENTVQDSSDLAELKQQCEGLGRQVNMLRIALVIASLTLTAYLGVQVRRTGKDLDAIRPQAMQVIEASKKETPGIQAFAAKLAEFGQAHSDFAPILKKYGIKPGTNAGLGAPVSPMTPAATPRQ